MQTLLILLAENTNSPFEEIQQITGYVVFFVALVFIELLIYLIFNRKPRIDQAIVRTGFGGAKVVVDSGIFVIPLIHTAKIVYLCQQTIMLEFKNETRLIWANHEEFEGSVFITVQIPPENSTMIINAARSFLKTSTPDDLLHVIEPAFRAAIRENFRTFRMETFDFEPNIVEVKLTRTLDIIAFSFGLKVRAVYIHRGQEPGDTTKTHIEKFLMKTDSNIIDPRESSNDQN